MMCKNILLVCFLISFFLNFSSCKNQNDNNQSFKTLQLENQFNDPKIIRHQQIINLVNGKKYSELNNLLENFQNLFEKDPVSYESDIEDIYFRTFSITDKRYENIFNEWVSLYPNSYAPYLARAYYNTAVGWKKRGGKWTSETTDEQFDEMSAYHSKAIGDLVRALEINSKLLIAYHKLIATEMAVSGPHMTEHLIIRHLKYVRPVLK